MAISVGLWLRNLVLSDFEAAGGKDGKKRFSAHIFGLNEIRGTCLYLCYMKHRRIPDLLTQKFLVGFSNKLNPLIKSGGASYDKNLQRYESLHL